MDTFKITDDYFHNLNYDIHSVYRNKCYKDNWGDENFVPYQNKIYLIVEGHLSFTIDDTKFEATAGDLILLPLHTRQSYHIISASFNHYWCHFLITIDRNNLDLLDVIRCPYKIHLTQSTYRQFEEMFLNLIQLNKNKERLSNYFKLYDVFNRLVSTYMDLTDQDIKPITPGPHVHQMTQIMDYINENMNRQISVEEMANRLHLHPNYFIRLFKSYFGLSPIKYINTVKVKKACELLLVQDESISNIATSLGYSDLFYFSRLFKQHTRMSPSAYRKQS